MQNNGAMLDEDYPYVSGTTMESTECREDPEKFVPSVDHFAYVGTDVCSIGEELSKNPLAMAISGDNDAFYFYESGIMKVDECSGEQDHAVVLVGYLPGSDSDDGDDEDSDEDGDDIGMVVNEVAETECRKQRWTDKDFETGCRNTDEFLVDGRFCCWDSIVITEVVKSLQSSTASWKVQNSWGTEWGENGHVRFEVADGDGVCNMNTWIHNVIPK